MSRSADASETLRDSRPIVRQATRRANWPWVTIVLVGVVLRAIAINHTPALTDEAFTFWRVCGTFGQMLDALRPDAFVPLHYEIVWLLTKMFGTGVWVLRLPAAIAGVLMPLALARLARVMFGHRAALPAALLTLSCAYFAFFSRNAKMYMPAWMMLTLATASILAYARSRRRLSLLTFIFFGVFAACLHSLVLLPLALSPILAAVWGRRRVLRTTLLTLAATAVVATGPALYYATCSQWFFTSGGLSGVVNGKPAMHKNGLEWVTGWQLGRTPENILLQCTTSYLTSVEWPGVRGKNWRSPATLYGLAFDITVLTLAVSAGIAVLAGVMMLIRRGSSIDRPRRLVLLVTLLVVPCYGFYLRSFQTLAAPWQGDWPFYAIAAAVFIILIRSDWRRSARSAAWFASAILLLIATWGALRIAYAAAPSNGAGGHVWPALWMPRYAAFIAPVLLATLGAAISILPTWPLRWLMLSPLLLANLTMTLLPQIYATQLPWPRFAADVASMSADRVVAVDWPPPTLGWLPSAYYEFVQANHIDVDPPTFRAGNQWPYRPGEAVVRALSERPIRTIQKAFIDPSTQTVVLWLRRRAEFQSPLGWQLVRSDEFPSYDTAEWGREETFHRREYRRIAAAPTGNRD